MGVLKPLVNAGLKASVTKDGRLQIWGDTSLLTHEQSERLYHYIKQNKVPIIAALSQSGGSGQCETCPAAGYWDYAEYAGRGLMCFHYAYFLGKPGKPKACQQARADCPRK